jgi:serine/threonine protein phosphatase PrpC
MISRVYPENAIIGVNGERDVSGLAPRGCAATYFGAVVRAHKRGEDRFCFAALDDIPSACFAGIFDGHSVRRTGKPLGDVCDSASRSLPLLLKKAHRRLAADGAQVDDAHQIGEALKVSFAEFQETHETAYEDVVMRDVEACRAEYASATSEEAPVVYPQEGGATATAVVVLAHALVVAWVGDSRAVLARGAAAGGGGAPGVAWESADHSAASNAAERARVAACGGEISGPFVSHAAVEGLLQAYP